MAGQDSLVKVLIPAGLKQDILRMLDAYGVSRVTLFPDLDGLSGYVNWETQRMAPGRGRVKGKDGDSV